MPKDRQNKLSSKKKCDFVKEQLKENIAKPSKLWKVLKSLGLSTKGSNDGKICLKDNGVAYFDPKETSGIFQTFYENLAQSLVDKLPTAPNKFNMDTIRDYYNQFNISNTLNLESIDSTMILDMLTKTYLRHLE